MKTILIGERYRVLLEAALKERGFDCSCIWLPDNPLLDKRLAGHADLSIFPIDDMTLAVSRHLYENEILVKELTNRGVNIIPCLTEQCCVYPKDVNLCACRVGKRVLHNDRYTDDVIKRAYDVIHVNQGYANCMVLALDDNRIITADKGIAASAEAAGIDVLSIRPGYIKLEGFNEGFIGGASFVAGGTVYFTGDISGHPEHAEIASFIKGAGLRVYCLTNNELIDIGSAVAI